MSTQLPTFIEKFLDRLRKRTSLTGLGMPTIISTANIGMNNENPKLIGKSWAIFNSISSSSPGRKYSSHVCNSIYTRELDILKVACDSRANLLNKRKQRFHKSF